MEYLPAAHKLHPSLVPLLLDTPVAEENLPAGQFLQDTMDVWKSWSPYWPAPHPTHDEFNGTFE